jgi:hypothetical protein
VTYPYRFLKRLQCDRCGPAVCSLFRASAYDTQVCVCRCSAADHSCAEFIQQTADSTAFQLPAAPVNPYTRTSPPTAAMPPGNVSSVSSATSSATSGPGPSDRGANAPLSFEANQNHLGSLLQTGYGLHRGRLSSKPPPPLGTESHLGSTLQPNNPAHSHAQTVRDGVTHKFKPTPPKVRPPKAPPISSTRLLVMVAGEVSEYPMGFLLGEEVLKSIHITSNMGTFEIREAIESQFEQLPSKYALKRCTCLI